MGWLALAGGVIGGLGSYLGGSKQASAQDALNKHAGEVNVQSFNTPWGPSTDYRGYGMQHALDLMKGYGPTDQGNGGPFSYPGGTPQAAPAPTGGGGGGGGNRGTGAFNPTGSDRYGGTGSGQTNFSGASGSTDLIQSALNARATGGSAYYQPAQDYTTSLLNGQETNGYRAAAAEGFQNFSDPELQRFESMLWGDTPGFLNSGPATSSLQAGGGFGGGNYQTPVGPVDTASYVKKILASQYDPNNPALAGMRDAATRKIKQDFYEKEIPGVTNEAQASGLYGGSTYANALAQSSGRFATSLGDTVSQMQYQDYLNWQNQVNNALGVGAGLDEAAGHDAAQVAASANSASASYQASLADNASREKLARLSALQGAISQGGSERQFAAAGLASIGDSFSTDQRAALGAVPELSGLDIRDLSAAGAMSQASDQNRLTARGQDFSRATSERGQDWQRAAEERGQDTSKAVAGIASRTQMSIAQQQIALQQQAFDFQKAQYEHEVPWQDLMHYSDVINAASGGYGSSQQIGYDRRSGAPVITGPNPFAQGISGAIGGYYVGQGIGQGINAGANYSPQGGVLAGYHGPVGGQPGAYPTG